MIQSLYSAQAWVVLLLGVAALAMELYAFIEAVRYPAATYSAAGKLTKAAWVGITGVAVLIGFAAVQQVFGIGLLAVVAAGVFLADVRPAIRQYHRPRRRGGASGRGPYGSW
ncbi:DUF2516 family protein [Austwickia chelonae]|uniref:DUF2516 family protein n=1 Tax=Austwickia chelonae TaxID=100225 RepID=UPI000E27ABC2|nr:DUF2516 family protein [Austwickia chelonae]